MKKSSNYGVAALVIVAIICVMFCMPIGILIGKSIYDKPDNIQVNNNVSNNNEEINITKEDILYNSKNEVEKLEVDSRFVQELYDCISFKDADDLFMTTDLYMDISKGKIVGASLNEFTDERIIQYAIHHMEGTIVSEDNDGVKKIQFKESDLRDIIAFVFGNNKVNNMDFNSLGKKNIRVNWKDFHIVIDNIENGIIEGHTYILMGTYVKTYDVSKIIRAEKDKQTGDIYIYESIVRYGELDNNVMDAYNAKFIYSEEDGVYYFNGIQFQGVFR